MAKYNLRVNGEVYTVDASPEMPLLWVLRDLIGLKGTKYSCGEGICGSCTVLINREPERACVLTLKDSADKEITTIEGLSKEPLNNLIRIWLEEEVSQCGYCQPGQILVAYAMLKKNPNPTEKEINEVMSANLCRCGTYPRIKKAIKKVIAEGGIK
jgi:isoquinoline 1-oxidoreductase alpha subunit